MPGDFAVLLCWGKKNLPCLGRPFSSKFFTPRRLRVAGGSSYNPELRWLSEAKFCWGVQFFLSSVRYVLFRSFLNGKY
uniref:Uncharacterized protein n=1 Tax=Anguilla anguilla TaxID=7936 RepID=A0A0E9X0J4_ANGAN